MKETGKVFHIGYMYRYNPYIQELMAQIKDGKLGEIISVEAQMNCTHPATTRQWLENLPGGMMFYLGSHLVDLIFRIQGKPEKIIPLNKCSGIDGVTAKDFGMAVFEYKNGVSFAKTTAVELGGFSRRQLVVNGTKATVELNPLEWNTDDLKGLQTYRTIRTSTHRHKLEKRKKVKFLTATIIC
ncbi:MAG: Gfo/Idh/MocA family oxidoreductase [Oscillospiraceae bacterium]|nr:Gfo/Idh/MocA family oxidoreductase [Oscillospiraceae bacterium]